MVGVGSVGTFCAIALYMCGDGTPLFLQIKEASQSVLEWLAPKFKGNQGQRVVEGQHVMQAATDIFLGWTEDAASHRQFYVRQLKNRRLGSIGVLVEEQALAATDGCAGARSRAPMHARPTRQYWRGIWANATCWTTRWRLLPWPMRGARERTTSNW